MSRKQITSLEDLLKKKLTARKFKRVLTGGLLLLTLEGGLMWYSHQHKEKMNLKLRYEKIEELANAGDYVEADTMMENLKTVVNDRKLAEKCRRLDKIIDREELQIAKQLLAERRLVPAKQLSGWDKSNWNSLYLIWRNIKKDDNFEGKEEVYDELALYNNEGYGNNDVYIKVSR